MAFLFGGNSGSRSDDRYDEQVEIAYEQAMNDYEYNWDRTQDNFNHSLLQSVITERNQEELLLHKEDEMERDWMYEVDTIREEWLGENAAFERGEKIFDHRVQMNSISADMSIKALADTTFERNQQVQFEAEAASIAEQAKAADIGYRGSLADLALSGKQQQTALSKEGKTLQMQAQRAGAAFKGQDLMIEQAMAEGKALSRGQAGVSASKEYQSIAAATGRQLAAISDQMSRADSAYNLEMFGLDASLATYRQEYDIGVAQRGTERSVLEQESLLGERQRAATQLSISRNFDRSYDQIRHDQYVANVDADMGRLPRPQEWDDVLKPPRPFHLPRAQFLPPMIPQRGPEPLEGAGSNGVGAAQDQANMVNGLISTATTIASALIICDMRIKHEVAELEYSEVNDVLADLAFTVKELREHN